MKQERGSKIIYNVHEVTDELFEQTYNKQILGNLEQRWGPFRQHHVDLTVSSEAMLTLIGKLREKKLRRGEVAMVVPDETGRIWLHTKAFYPEDAFRLMTGGISPGELPAMALRREVEEETGFQVDIERCLAVITYMLSGQDAPLPFVSYVFLTTPGQGFPEPMDTGEKITGFKAVPPAELHTVAENLRTLNGRYRDWGIFRAIAHDVTADLLLDEVA